jgi:type VI protein secretion system component VasK
MPGPIDLAGLAVVVVALWVFTVIFRLKSRWHLYVVFRRALLTAVVVAIAVFCWNLATSLR